MYQMKVYQLTSVLNVSGLTKQGKKMQEPNYSGFTGVGGSPSPSSPAYPPASHVAQPESQPFLPAPLYPPSSKSVLSYMGAAGHMSSSSLLSGVTGGQPPSPSWQSSPPTSATQVIIIIHD